MCVLGTRRSIKPIAPTLECAWKTRRREWNWLWSCASRSIASFEKLPTPPTIALVCLVGVVCEHKGVVSPRVASPRRR